MKESGSYVRHFIFSRHFHCIVYSQFSRNESWELLFLKPVIFNVHSLVVLYAAVIQFLSTVAWNFLTRTAAKKLEIIQKNIENVCHSKFSRLIVSAVSNISLNVLNFRTLHSK
jgi:hypothetical protein